MDTKYTNLLDSNTATMLLYGEIGSPEMSAEYFTAEMRFHNSMGRKIKVYINSPGGNVFGGYSIIQAIIDYEADTHIVGLAASMGGVIAQFGKHRTANDFAVAMIHMPRPKNGTKGNVKLLDIVSESLIGILVSRTGKSEESMKALMEKETFFDADEMLAIGLIDEIVSTNVAAVENVKTLSVGDLYNVYNKIIVNKNEKMEKLKGYFKLGNDANEDIILAKITDLDDAIQTGKEEVVAQAAQISTLQAELEKMRIDQTVLIDELADTIVISSINDGKITKDAKDVWVAAAKKDPSAVKAQLGSLKAIQNISVQTSVVNTNGTAPAKPEDDIVAWVKSPVGARKLIELEDSDPTEYERIWALYEEKLDIKK